jgi:hypothetical protein
MARRGFVFAQLLGILPRTEFDRIVKKYKGDHYTKTFRCWDQLACMMFAHIRQENSLRDIDIALNSNVDKLYHIGIKQCPKSTLARANEKRNFRIYEEFAKLLMLRARKEYSNTELKVEIENAVYALDASTIDLCLSLFNWAKFRKTKGAIKLHAMIDLRGNIPSFLSITDGKVSDIKAAPQIILERESIYVVDRGYVDFKWLGSIEEAQAFFVTRLKSNIGWKRILSHPVNKSLGVRADQEILLESQRLQKLYPKRLRRVSYRDEELMRTFYFLTNNFELPSETIAALYKSRWEIELFFKWIKQNLRVKTFYGTSANAVKTQIWIAMIVYLELAIIRERYGISESLSKILHFLETNLFHEKPIQQVFARNPRKNHADLTSNQLKLFGY